MGRWEGWFSGRFEEKVCVEAGWGRGGVGRSGVVGENEAWVCV